MKAGVFVSFITPRVSRSDYTCPALFERRLLLPEPATPWVLSPAKRRAFSCLRAIYFHQYGKRKVYPFLAIM